MDKIRIYTDDVLRVLKNYFPDRAKTVDVIVYSYFRFIISSKYNTVIESRILEKKWGVSIEEGGILLTPLGEEYIDSLLTDEYLIDRFFEYIKVINSPTIIDEVLRTLHLKLEEPHIKYLEALLVESELIESTKFGSAYHYSLKLNSKGLIALTKYESYSDFLDSSSKAQFPETSHLPQVINQTFNVAGNLHSSGNYNSKIITPPDRSRKSLWNTTVLIWIGIVGTVIGGLVIYYFTK